MKNKILLGLAASSFVASTTLADVYVGVDFGNTDAKFEAELNGASLGSSNDDGGSQTIKVGYYMDANNRVAVFYQNINVDGGDAGVYGLGYDYFIGDHDLKPFVGLMIGQGNFEVDGLPVDISGFVYGMELGLNYAINRNVSFEAGYRYLKSEMEDTITGPGGSATFTIDPVKNWYVGINYKF